MHPAYDRAYSRNREFGEKQTRCLRKAESRSAPVCTLACAASIACTSDWLPRLTVSDELNWEHRKNNETTQSLDQVQDFCPRTAGKFDTCRQPISYADSGYGNAIPDRTLHVEWSAELTRRL